MRSTWTAVSILLSLFASPEISFAEGPLNRMCLRTIESLGHYEPVPVKDPTSILEAIAQLRTSIKLPSGEGEPQVSPAFIRTGSFESSLEVPKAAESRLAQLESDIRLYDEQVKQGDRPKQLISVFKIAPNRLRSFVRESDPERKIFSGKVKWVLATLGLGVAGMTLNWLDLTGFNLPYAHLPLIGDLHPLWLPFQLTALGSIPFFAIHWFRSPPNINKFKSQVHEISDWNSQPNTTIDGTWFYRGVSGAVSKRWIVESRDTDRSNDIQWNVGWPSEDAERIIADRNQRLIDQSSVVRAIMKLWAQQKTPPSLKIDVDYWIPSAKNGQASEAVVVVRVENPAQSVEKQVKSEDIPAEPKIVSRSPAPETSVRYIESDDWNAKVSFETVGRRNAAREIALSGLEAGEGLLITYQDFPRWFPFTGTLIQRLIVQSHEKNEDFLRATFTPLELKNGADNSYSVFESDFEPKYAFRRSVELVSVSPKVIDEIFGTPDTSQTEVTRKGGFVFNKHTTYEFNLPNQVTKILPKQKQSEFHIGTVARFAYRLALGAVAIGASFWPIADSADGHHRYSLLETVTARRYESEYKAAKDGPWYSYSEAALKNGLIDLSTERNEKIAAKSLSREQRLALLQLFAEYMDEQVNALTEPNVILLNSFLNSKNLKIGLVDSNRNLDLLSIAFYTNAHVMESSALDRFFNSKSEGLMGVNRNASQVALAILNAYPEIFDRAVRFVVAERNAGMKRYDEFRRPNPNGGFLEWTEAEVIAEFSKKGITRPSEVEPLDLEKALKKSDMSTGGIY